MKLYRINVEIHSGDEEYQYPIYLVREAIPTDAEVHEIVHDEWPDAEWNSEEERFDYDYRTFWASSVAEIEYFRVGNAVFHAQYLGRIEDMPEQGATIRSLF
jgi:hypothetical protein